MSSKREAYFYKMIDLQKIQILAQLLDNLQILSKQLEKYYNENNAEMFKKIKKEMLDVQNKISTLV